MTQKKFCYEITKIPFVVDIRIICYLSQIIRKVDICQS